MAAPILEGPDQVKALRSCRDALRRVAGYALNPTLDKRLLELSERKEFLEAGEYAELMALVDFTQQRTIEKLEAQVALQRLESVYPELTSTP